jgi:phospholipid/cholesterol/gamma-HCH transport system substrate-binding protein
VNKRHKLELRAGLFVNLGLALALVSIVVFGDSVGFFTPRLHFQFTVPDAQGLISGAKVLVAGVDAGQVEHISVDSRSKNVQVAIRVSPKFRNTIRQDSHAELATQGVLGDKLVLITPGSPEQPEIPDHGELVAHTSTNFNQLAAQGDVLLQNLDRLVLQFNQTLKAGKLEGMLTSLGSILAKIDHGNGTLGALVNDPSLYNDAKDVVGETNRNRIVRNLVRKSIEDADEKAGTPGNKDNKENKKETSSPG